VTEAGVSPPANSLVHPTQAQPDSVH